MLFSSRRVVAGLLICWAVVMAWFSPWWAGGQNLAPLDLLNEMMQPWRGASVDGSAKNHIVSDAVDQYLVYRMIAADQYAKEGWVGWSSLTYGGTAQHANTMALYYDWTMQLHRCFDFWTAWHLGLLMQVLLAAWGMLLFLRGRGIGLLWSCCGALAYAANSQFVVWIYHRWTLGAFCWVPWILWAIDASRRGGRVWQMLVPVFIALSMLGGTLQHAAFIVLVVVASWIEQALKSGWVPRLQWSLLSRYLVWGLLGIGMAAMMLLPCAVALLESSRMGMHQGMHVAGAGGLYPQGSLQPLLNLAAYPLQVFPSILGRAGTVDLLKFFKSELWYVAYFGALPVLLAFRALFRKDSPVLARCLVGMGLLLPLTPLVRVLYQRLFLLFIVGGILGFAHFMQQASRETRLAVFRVMSRGAVLAVLVWLVASAVLQWQAARVDALLLGKVSGSAGGGSFGFFKDWLQARVLHFADELLIWSPQQLWPLLLLAAGLAGLRMSAGRHAGWRNRGAVLVACVVVMELTLFASRWVVFSDPAQHPLFPVTPEVTALRERVGRDGRVVQMIEESGNHMAVTPFIPNTLAAYGIATIGGYDSIMPDGMFRVNDPRRDAVTLGRFGVSHLVTYAGNPVVGADWTKVWESVAMDLYANPAAMPRYAGFAAAADLADFFDGDAGGNWLALQERGGRENWREIEVPAGIRRIRLAENAVEGWEYRTPAGPWRSVVRGPDASMVLELDAVAEAGVVEMRYRSRELERGLMISAVALLLTLASGMMSSRTYFSSSRSPCPSN
ncbi:MAG: hypothetical protein EAZ84_11910 [Verrucomicrobia bacterium]|nr:MAG: hypothetical protein EAZ84_11910 [Verrucomicrobiota bacterium]TAE86057.1 MAG: hypothetical protein EAZ82_12415 [Verrucomicrobiota bacterium]TAF25846.1 MAG: hypothetical protein EAZ71_06800 [Verrucomicrobiota bacterium]